MKLLALLIAIAAAAAGQTATVFRVIPITSTTTGLPTAVGKIEFRDLASPSVELITLSAPNAITTGYNIRLPQTNTTGCLKNTAVTSTATLSFTPCATFPVTDDTVLLSNLAAPTKLARLSAALITAGQTRVASIPDADFTFAGINIAQTFTANQTLSNLDVALSGTVNIGSGAADRVAQFYGLQTNTEILRIIDYGFGTEQYFLGKNATSGTLFLTNHLSARYLEVGAGAGVRSWTSLGVTNSSVCTLGSTCYMTGFEAPTSLAGNRIWTMPSVDGSGTSQCWGYASAFVLGWNDCGGVSSVTGTSPIVSSGGSTPAISCPTCVTSGGSQTISGSKTFTANQTLSAMNVALSGTVNIGSGAADRVEQYYGYQTNTEILRIIDYAFGSEQYFLGKNATSATLFLTNQVATRYLEVGAGAGVRSWTTLGVTNSSVCTLGGTCRMTGFQSPTSLPSDVIYTMPTGFPSANGQALTSTTAGVMSWATTMTNPLTTTGDMIYSSSGSTPARLGIGGNTTMLFSNGGAPFWSTLNTLYSTLLPNSNGVYDLGSSGLRYATTYSNNFVGGSLQFTGGFSTSRCLRSDTSAFVSPGTTDCIPTSRTISTSSPLGGGGDLSADRTLTIQQGTTSQNGYISSTDWNTFNGKAGTSSPTFTGTVTIPTLSMSTAISGTYNLSGNETVTGNWYGRSFSGGDANCSGVANAWFGFRVDTNEIQMCSGGALKKIALI